MATTNGLSFNQLVQSLSAQGSTSANYSDISTTGINRQVRPLTDYDSFANHVFFGDAISKFRTSLLRIEDTYPIGLNGIDPTSLSAKNVFDVDKWKKESKGFDLWLLDQLGSSDTITASSTNNNGEIVPLVWVKRNSGNSITGSQTATVNSISAEAHYFEEENIAIINQTPGTKLRDGIDIGATTEISTHRGAKLNDMLPDILFAGDEKNILENLLNAMGDLLDDLKEYVDQMANVKTQSYDEINRVPNKFLPVLANQFGVELFQSSINSSVESFLSNSTSGLTTQEITYSIWNRILNNIQYLAKAKGTKDVLKSIAKIYGLDQNFIRTDEYSLFENKKLITEREEIDVPVLFSTGDIYCQVPTGSVSSFDFNESNDFTLEARVSLTSNIDQKIIIHPNYELLIKADGRVVFDDLIGSASAITESNSAIMTQYMRQPDNFINVVATRSGSNLNVYALCLSGSNSGGNDIVVSSSGTNVISTDFNSNAGDGTFGAYFPASGTNVFNGYIHEVRAWNVALNIEDLYEHTRNLESFSFQNSTASPVNATLNNLLGHYRLKENIVLTGDYNFIVDSSLTGLTAEAVNFGTIPTKRYKVFSNQQRFYNWYPSGLSRDNDKIITESNTGSIDSGYVSFHLTPIEAVNNDIRNMYEKIDVVELLGNPLDLYESSYGGPIKQKFDDLVSRYNNKDIADINTFVKAMDNFNDVLGGIFPFVKQFFPARTNLLSEGILISNPILERPKYKRKIYTTDDIHPTAFSINTHYNIEEDSITSVNIDSFQGRKYIDGVYEDLDTTISANKFLKNAGSFSKETYSKSRVSRLSPVKSLPSDPDNTEIDITLSRIHLSPSASVVNNDGIIRSKISILSKGSPINSNVASIEINFPSSSDGNNYFKANIGKVSQGLGKLIEGKENSTILTLEKDSLNGIVEMELELSDQVKSLSADTSSLSGTLGVFPLRITNLFNNASQIVRLGIGIDENVINQLQSQGGIKLQT